MEPEISGSLAELKHNSDFRVIFSFSEEVPGLSFPQGGRCITANWKFFIPGERERALIELALSLEFKTEKMLVESTKTPEPSVAELEAQLLLALEQAG